VHQAFQHEVADLATSRNADRSLRQTASIAGRATTNPAIFEPDVDVRKCRFIWLGTTQKFDASPSAFGADGGMVGQIHAYQFSKDLSTVLLKRARRRGRPTGGPGEYGAVHRLLRNLFGQYLGGTPLRACNHLRGSAWLNFNRVTCQGTGTRPHRFDWRCRPHSPFFHRLGTKLAMEDAISLVKHVTATMTFGRRLGGVFTRSEMSKFSNPECRALRMEWFENVTRLTSICHQSNSPYSL